MLEGPKEKKKKGTYTVLVQVMIRKHDQKRYEFVIPPSSLSRRNLSGRDLLDRFHHRSGVGERWVR